MAKPPPRSGLVIRYDYLWRDEAGAGRREGAKVRPCAVVVAVPATGDRPLHVVVCGITHGPPASAENGKIEIPRRVKAALGLDPARSWIVADEVNYVAWDDPGIVPVAPGRWAYGELPAGLTRQLIDEVRRRGTTRTLGLVDRPAIEKSSHREGG